MPERPNAVRRMPEYKVWSSMIQRCTNPRREKFASYGGAGIKVCFRWLDSFAHFLMDVGPRPEPGMQLDRFPDQKGNYEPGNVRWATKRQQNRNKRNNVFLTHEGKTLIMSDWAQRLDLPVETIFWRIKKGLSTEQVLSPKRLTGPGSGFTQRYSRRAK